MWTFDGHEFDDNVVPVKTKDRYGVIYQITFADDTGYYETDELGWLFMQFVRNQTKFQPDEIYYKSDIGKARAPFHRLVAANREIRESITWYGRVVEQIFPEK